jgi:hypothetical protein
MTWSTGSMSAQRRPNVGPTHGEKKNNAWNGHAEHTCDHPLSGFNQLCELKRCSPRLAMFPAMLAAPVAEEMYWSRS